MKDSSNIINLKELPILMDNQVKAFTTLDMFYYDENIKDIKEYCNIDKDFTLKLPRIDDKIIICYEVTDVNLQCYIKLDIFDTENKLISKNEHLYLSITNDKVECVDFLILEGNKIIY